jgi:hypothetical protein
MVAGGFRFLQRSLVGGDGALRPGSQLFEQARARSAAAVGPAQDAFKELLQADASNPSLIAYYGSTFAMRARDGGAPWQKIKWVKSPCGAGQVRRLKQTLTRRLLDLTLRLRRE